MSERTASVTLTMKVRAYQTGADQVVAANKKVQGSLHSLTAELNQAAKAGKLDHVADSAGRMGLALTGAFAVTVAAAAKFEKAMSGVSAATHAPVKTMELLRAAALQAGKDTQYSGSQAAQAMTELAKAGVTTSAILGGALKGSLALAAAGQLDVGEAAETAASAMTQFKLKGSDVGHVADLLAAGAGKAQGSVHDLGMALNQGGLVASQMGLSVEETTGTLAAFASAGLIGSDAGTSFKTMLIALAKPSKEAAATMDDLGIKAYDTQGKFVGTTKLAGQLQTRLKGLTQEQRNAALVTIFGNDAIRAASVLYDDGAKGIQAWTKAVNEQGYAAKTASELTNNLSGDVERLQSSLETMAVESGSGANAGLRALTKAANGLVDQFASLPPTVGGTVTVLAGLGGATLLAASGWVKLRRSATEALTQLRSAGRITADTAAGLQSTAKWAGRAATAFAVLQVAQTAAHAIQTELNPQTDALAKGLAAYGRSGILAGEASRVLGENLGDLNAGFKFLADTDNTRRNVVRWGQSLLESVVPGLDGTNTSMARTKERVTAVDGALSALVQGGKSADATAFFNRFAAAQAAQGISLDEVKAKFPQYTAALETAGTASDTAAAGAKGLAGGMQSAATAADTEKAALKGLNDALHAQADPAFALLNAQKGLKDAQKGATQAQKEFGRKSPEAKAALRTLAEAAIDLEGAAAGLGDSFKGKLPPALRATLTAAGLTTPQIKALERQFKTAKKAGDDFTGDYKANVSAPGVVKATQHIHDFNWGVRQIPETANTHVTVTGDQAVLGKLTLMGQAQQALKRGTNLPAPLRHAFDFYDGGWTGPGGKYQPAGVVHADEFVIQKSSRQKIEQNSPGLLDHMNRTGEVSQGYAGGGRVAVWPFPVNAAGTRVPSPEDVASVVSPAGPPGGATDDFIVRVVKRAFPGLDYISKFRPGAHTLSGNVSLHAQHRAVDWPASRPLAEWWNLHYLSKTKEFISPWNDLNIHNGKRHSYSGAVYRQHSGSNAHDHIAMANGGVIREPVFGVGRSGRTYSFGEGGRAEAVVPFANGGLVNVAPPVSAEKATRLDSAEAYAQTRSAVKSLTDSLKENGRSFSFATAKGQANRSALYQVIRAAQDAAKTKFDETGSVKQADRAYDSYIARLRATLVQQKLNATEVRSLLSVAGRPGYGTASVAPKNSLLNIGFARSLIGARGSLADLQDSLSLNGPTTNTGSKEGRDNLSNILGFLEAASTAAQDRYAQTGSSKSATTLYNGFVTQLRQALTSNGYAKTAIDKLITEYGRITLVPNATGGVYGAQAYGPGSTLYQFREPSTKGEAFIPRQGGTQASADRVLAIAAGWRGGQYIPQGATAGGAGGGHSSSLVVNNYGDRMTLSQFRANQRELDVKARVGRNN